MGIPQNRWCIVENPIKMDDLGVPLFQETAKWGWKDTISLLPPICVNDPTISFYAHPAAALCGKAWSLNHVQQ